MQSKEKTPFCHVIPLVSSLEFTKVALRLLLGAITQMLPLHVIQVHLILIKRSLYILLLQVKNTTHIATMHNLVLHIQT